MASKSSKRTYASFSEPYGSSSLLSNPVPSAKRSRRNEPSLWSQILSLPHPTTQSLLYQICHANPNLAAFVQSAHNARLAEEAARPPVNFDHYSRDCWYTMNKKYKRLSCSKQFEMMGDICQVLDESREAIVAAAGPDVRWETRRNALEVLRKICKSIALCDEPQIRHELTKDGFMLGQFADSMQELARGMNEEEKERYKAEGLYEKLVDLSNDCGPDDMEGLPAVFRIFDSSHEDGDEDEQDEALDESEDGGDCDADSREYVGNLYDDDTEEENHPGEEDEVGFGTAAIGLPAGVRLGALREIYSQNYQQMTRPGQVLHQPPVIPSQPPRTKVFSIGELS
ncbi:uncharacterized protein L3040_005304 [Drepanopeziza brunnea f. sp. 'multigermtubi']|uniref:Uncharacterized protein n=1 Tax=Marssonina brunnea f. sp. multigermtubi (strain MB_m1) TaxID=1072389 RepID=K1X9N6_MARBU|nr:uncharacterized protein MBM_00909 [Drepanopeziza brunnea f. sp. 'multigermtubi' MB_m1]EKD21796.1 hypothetical protein MBM_00909 [Drepanopeziza brunnea f. sp. 'multigermtubi' MB_m1]KAJ5041735.1 hypothetical protein L3040_005304 [Drepanopeziza brunnea f. sp. 'multigermtubi']